MKEQFEICKYFGHPFRYKGSNDFYSVCRNCRLCITSRATHDSHRSKRDWLHRKGLVNLFYRKIFNLN